MDYRSNSDSVRENGRQPEKKKVEKVIEGTAKVKKKTLADKIIDSLLPEGVTDFKDYLIFDVVIPNGKRIILDSINNLLGDGTHRNVKSSKNSYVSYRNNYNEADRREARNNRISDYDDIRFDSYREAEIVLEGMYEILDDYPTVSIADFYDLAGISTGNYTLSKYGWMSLKNAQVIRCRDGSFGLRLPKAMRID